MRADRGRLASPSVDMCCPIAVQWLCFLALLPFATASAIDGDPHQASAPKFNIRSAFVSRNWPSGNCVEACAVVLTELHTRATVTSCLLSLGSLEIRANATPHNLQGDSWNHLHYPRLQYHERLYVCPLVCRDLRRRAVNVRLEYVLHEEEPSLSRHIFTSNEVELEEPRGGPRLGRVSVCHAVLRPRETSAVEFAVSHYLRLGIHRAILYTVWRAKWRARKHPPMSRPR